MQYLDLFDDGLYDPVDFSQDERQFNHLTNTLRLQVVLSILFRADSIDRRNAFGKFFCR